MLRPAGIEAMEADLNRLYRAAERAGYALGCIDVDEEINRNQEIEDNLPLTRTMSWMWVSALVVLFIMV